MVNFKNYRLLCVRIEEVNDFIGKLEEWGKIADTTQYIKKAYTEREQLEAEQEQARKFIKNIPNERYRIMFYLYYIKNYTKRAIAEYLGVSEGYIHRLWNKAIKEVQAYE